MGHLTAMYVNDYDLSQLGLVVERVDGWLDALSVNDRTTALPGRVGQVILAPEPESTPRIVSVTGVMQKSSLAALRTAIHELGDKLYNGLIEVRFSDEPTKMILARAQGRAVIATAPQFKNPKTRVSFRLFCPDPLIYEKVGGVASFSSALGPMPLGNAISAPTIIIKGAATNPVVTYKNIAGETVETMAFGALSLLSTDYLLIDCELMQIWKYTSGVKASAINDQTSGDFIKLDAQDGDYANAVWPTLEVNSGTGEAHYRKAWI